MKQEQQDYIKIKFIMFDKPGEEVFHKDTSLGAIASYLAMMCSTYVITGMYTTSRKPLNKNYNEVD